MDLRRSLAVARFAVMTGAKSPLSRVGVGILFVVALLGPLISLRNHGVWSFDPDLLGTGLAFAAVFTLRSGLAEQRAGGLQTFLRLNFVRPVEHMLGIILALLCSWIGVAAAGLLVGLLLSGGDVAAAAWVAWMMLLISGMLLPFVLMVEAVSELRTPLFVPGLTFFAGLFILAAALGAERAVELAGLVADRADPRTSLPLALRSGVAMGAGFPLILSLTWLRERRSGGVTRDMGRDSGSQSASLSQWPQAKSSPGSSPK